MIKKIFQQLLKIKYPGRKFKVAKFGKKILTIIPDCLGDLNYSLQGYHSYKEVQKLNELTTYSSRYGYCYNIGPIAIIGIPNENVDWKYFNEVLAYGEMNFYEDIEFKEYSKETAEKISNYKVYGLLGIKKIADFVKFDKIKYIYDYRYKEVCSHEHRVLKMKCKLEGLYSFKETEILAKEQQRWAVDRNMAYATLENNQHVAIMSFSYDRKDEVSGFRDIWETGNPEPPIQKITFMTNEEAMEIRDFSIYLYDYRFFYTPEKAPSISKIDRTFEPSFDFYDTNDGKDLRLSKQL